MTKGTLYICATPIGNLEDVSYRLKRVLSEVDMIAAEDTRRTLKLLNHLGIKKPLFSCHRYNENERAQKILSILEQGKNVALVSDAGMPCISDPGEAVVRLAVASGCSILAVPGPSAALTALALSCLDTSSFVFTGFLPREGRKRREAIAALSNETRTSILYEAPHRLLETLQDLQQALGDRKISISRELTKLHEETFRGTLSSAIEHFQGGVRGEIAIVLEGIHIQKEKREALPGELEENLKKWLAQGMTKKAAAKKAADVFSISKGEAYMAATKLNRNTGATQGSETI
ncbi:MAG: 16S rRNA (cytidine(1402)-2'-O)-methyltransferase [Bacillota bacterium]|nr:16S rRNA (cytidine(1402)-2'-O)-methyltransferase [Bacillota bacterium]